VPTPCDDETGYVIDDEVSFSIDLDCEVVNWFTFPCIWVAKPVTETEHDSDADWQHIDCYRAKSDPGGWIALEYGATQYREGMDPNNHRDVQQACFEEAEMLYLHSAAHGNPLAFLNLGYLYSYDRCKGHYFQDHGYDGTPAFADFGIEEVAPFDRRRRAFISFQKAAKAGIAEGVYKLGDLYAKGWGCEQDEREAYRLFVDAYRLSRKEDDSVRGSAALRLANCHENGQACEQSFERALSYYEEAATDLEASVKAGHHYYEKSLSRATKGIKRLRQERAARNEPPDSPETA
jgi:TPR repeat protein